MNREQVRTLVENATAGLEGDAELRLDVQAELASHIESAAESHRAEGKSEDESLELAAKSFGSPLDVAAELARANRSRMKWRAVARFASQILLIPAALAAVWFALSRHSLFNALPAIASLGGDEWPQIYGFATQLRTEMSRELTPDQRLIVFGDASRTNTEEQQRAIWEKDPTNRVFYGNYITHLISSCGVMTDSVTAVRIETAVRDGERLDPDNARYNYLLASLMLNRAAEVLWDKPVEGSTNTETRLVVKDRQLLDAAMTEFTKGLNKPFMATYTKEMFALRMSLLPPSRNMVERVWKVGIAAGLLLPDLARARQQMRANILYGQLLLSEGRKDEANLFFGSWLPFSRHIFDRSFTLIDELVGFAIVAMGEDRAAAQMEAAGEAERAAVMRRQAEILMAPKKNWAARRESLKADVMEKRKVGILTGLLMPALGEPLPSDKDLSFERLTWCVMVEEGGLMTLLFLFLLFMGGMLIAFLRWRWVRGSAAAPLLILPGWRKLGMMLLFAVAIPVGVYYLYTRHSGLAGREMSLRPGIFFIVAELLVLSAVILCASVVMSVRHTWRRCRELGIAVPPNVSAGKLIGITLVPLGLFVWLMRGRGEGLFRGSVARSLIPVFAGVVVLLGVTAAPYLKSDEQWLIERDPMFTSIERGEGFTTLETRLVNRLRQEVMAAYESLDKP